MNAKSIAVTALLCLAAALGAQENAEVSVTARVESRCKLEVSAVSVSFTSVSPDVEESIPQSEPPVEITVKLTRRPGRRVVLRVEADGALVDPASGRRLDPSSISWVATGPRFRSGRLRMGAPVEIAAFNQSGEWKGSVTFYFQNRDEFPPGTYRLAITLNVSSF